MVIEVLSEDPLLHEVAPSSIALDSNKDACLVYPFSFKSKKHAMLLDTGADQSVISKKFAEAHALRLNSPNNKYVRVANGARVPVLGEALPFSVRMVDINSTFRGLVIDNLSHDIIAGVDWLRTNRPVIDWESSVLTLRRNGVGFQIYPDSLDVLRRETVFVRVVEHEDCGPYQKGHLPPLHQCSFKVVRFSKDAPATVEPASVQRLKQEFADVFAEELLGLPPRREVEHSIQLEGNLPKARPLYRLSPKEDDALKAYLEKALALGLIRPSLSPYGAAVFFVQKKNGDLCLVTDYRVLNQVNVKNRYPFLLLTTSLMLSVGHSSSARSILQLVTTRSGSRKQTFPRLPSEHVMAAMSARS